MRDKLAHGITRNQTYEAPPKSMEEKTFFTDKTTGYKIFIF